MLTIKFQAREIFRAAKRNGAYMEKSNGFQNCAMGLALAAAGQPLKNLEEVYAVLRTDIYQHVADVVGLKSEDMIELERGHDKPEWPGDSKYRKIGRNLRKLNEAQWAKVKAKS